MYWELKIGIAALAFPFHSPWGPLQADAFGKKLLRTDFCRALRFDTASPSFAKEGLGRILGMTK